MKTLFTNQGRASCSKTALRWLTASALITTLALLPPIIEQGTDLEFGTSVFAAGNGGDNGKGGGDGGSGDGGGGNSGGRGKDRPSKGELFGDQVYLDRNINGVPFVDNNGCLRPIIPPFSDDNPGALIPLVGDGAVDPDYSGIETDVAVCVAPPAVSEVDSDDGELDVCDVVTACIDVPVEVELGRLSVLRAPEKVLDQQRQEAIKNIDAVTDKDTGEMDVILDAGGRLVAGGSTFDSPLVNLALHRDFLLLGGLYDRGDADGRAVWLPGVGEAIFPSDDNLYESVIGAAVSFAAGDDKAGNPVDMEVIARTAKILGLAEKLDGGTYPSPLPPPLPGPVNYPDLEPFTGEDVFINFSGYSGYNRATTYPGYICYLNLDTLKLEKALIIDAVFEETSTDPATDNIAGFAQAAEDARKVIVFTHDYVLTEDTWADPIFEVSDANRSCEKSAP